MKLEQDEKILRVIRKHPFYMIIETMGLIIIAFMPSLLLLVWNLTVAQLASIGLLESVGMIPIGLQGFLYSLWFLTCWMLWLTRFTDFYLDKWIITNKRIIDIEQIGFFARETSSIRFNYIQDISAKSKGLFETIFRFGTLTVQSAGTVQEFELTLAPNPVAQKEFIIDFKQRLQHHTI